MKWSFATIGLIIIGLFGIAIILLFHEITVSNEQDYYTLKDATEASMIEAIDSTYYRLTGKLKMSEEKFVENFTKRFIETSTFGQGNYYIDFYQITEYPAKVSLRIIDATNSYNIYTTFDVSVSSTQTNVVNELSAILDGYEADETYGVYLFDKDFSSNDPSTPPPSKGSCTAIKPQYRCISYENSPFKNDPNASMSTPRYDISSEMCFFEVIIGNDSAGSSVPMSSKASITCSNPSKYVLNKSTGWCECK